MCSCNCEFLTFIGFSGTMHVNVKEHDWQSDKHKVIDIWSHHNNVERGRDGNGLKWKRRTFRICLGGDILHNFKIRHKTQELAKKKLLIQLCVNRSICASGAVHYPTDSYTKVPQQHSANGSELKGLLKCHKKYQQKADTINMRSGMTCW